MPEAAPTTATAHRPLAWVLLALAAVILAGLWIALRQDLPGRGPGALLSPAPDDMAALLAHYALLPRLAVALASGAALAAAGVLMQQVLRNPLAAPSTLGIAGGAQLALSLGLLLAPGLTGQLGRPALAFAGGALAAGLTLLLARRSGYAPVVVMLSGMVVAMLTGTIAAALVLFHENTLRALFIWGSGSLVQDSWTGARRLIPVIALAGLLILPLLRSLRLLELGDQAQSLGVPVALIRAVTMGLAVLLTASVVATVGQIGFIGLAAPAIVRAMGVRGLGARLALSALTGALLLAATDSALQLAARGLGLFLPAGAVTALLGAPVLLWLIPRLRRLPAQAEALPTPALPHPGAERRTEGLRLMLLALALGCLALLALTLGRTAQGGWTLSQGAALEPLLHWRWPRSLGAGCAGAMLALAGVLLQRQSRNPMASPELLGLGAGAALGLCATLFLWPGQGYWAQYVGAGLGAGLVLGLLSLAATRARVGADQILLLGVAFGAFAGAVLVLLLASGDPRMMLLAGWMAGSTYDLTAATAGALALSLALLLPVCLILGRRLQLLQLGEGGARALGLAPAPARAQVVGLAALLTAGATLAVGPLGFVGLMGPHLARAAGLRRPGAQMLGAALIGALIMMAADLTGRLAYFPYQVPAGLVASLLGAPVLLRILAR